MDVALGAATAAVSRAGASSLAELAAMRLPSLLVPFPAAADNHQFYNARAFEATGAARLLEQKGATPGKSRGGGGANWLKTKLRVAQMQAALAQWHAPKAAEQIAENILRVVSRSADSLSACLTPDTHSRTSHPRSNKTEQEHYSTA